MLKLETSSIKPCEFETYMKLVQQLQTYQNVISKHDIKYDMNNMKSKATINNDIKL